MQKYNKFQQNSLKKILTGTRTVIMSVKTSIHTDILSEIYNGSVFETLVSGDKKLTVFRIKVRLQIGFSGKRQNSNQ